MEGVDQKAVTAQFLSRMLCDYCSAHMESQQKLNFYHWLYWKLFFLPSLSGIFPNRGKGDIDFHNGAKIKGFQTFVSEHNFEWRRPCRCVNNRLIPTEGYHTTPSLPADHSGKIHHWAAHPSSDIYIWFWLETWSGRCALATGQMWLMRKLHNTLTPHTKGIQTRLFLYDTQLLQNNS